MTITTTTPRQQVQADLLAALSEADALHTRQRAGEDVPEATVHETYARIDSLRAALHGLEPELPASPSLRQRLRAVGV